MDEMRKEHTAEIEHLRQEVRDGLQQIKEFHVNVPNTYLLEEIRANRVEIRKIQGIAVTKVGRGELFGWFSGLAVLVGMIASIDIAFFR